MTANIFQTRADLRQRLLASSHSSAAANAHILRHVIALLTRLRPHIVAVYWPLANEVDIRSAVLHWCQTQTFAAQVVLPYARKKNTALDFLLWQEDAALTQDAYHIPAPQHKQYADPDLIFVPCLGFTLGNDGKYYRLGRGGGCYDRTLADRKVTSCGIAYASAYLEDFLPQAHDHDLDYCITEKEIANSAV